MFLIKLKDARNAKRIDKSGIMEKRCVRLCSIVFVIIAAKKSCKKIHTRRTTQNHDADSQNWNYGKTVR